MSNCLVANLGLRNAETWPRPRTKRGERVVAHREPTLQRRPRALPGPCQLQPRRRAAARLAFSAPPGTCLKGATLGQRATPPSGGTEGGVRSRPQHSARSVTPPLSLGHGAGVAGGRSAKPKLQACCRRGRGPSPLLEGARRGAPRAQGAPNRSGGGAPRACSATKQTRRWCCLRRRDARAVRWESGQKSTKDTLRCAWVVLDLSRPQCGNRPDDYSACCLVLPRALRRSSRARGKQLQSAPPTPSSCAFARPRDRLTRLGAPVCRSPEPGIEAR